MDYIYNLYVCTVFNEKEKAFDYANYFDDAINSDYNNILFLSFYDISIRRCLN